MTAAGLSTVLILIAAGLVPGVAVLIARRHLPGGRGDGALMDYLRLPPILVVLALWWLALAALAVLLAGRP